MKWLFIAVTALVALISCIHIDDTVTAQAPTRLPAVADHVLNQPALSPDGKTLAFVYDGDIWLVAAEGGTARRVTVTEGDDDFPVFSPDGRWLAFHSYRTGHGDCFVMPASGGPAKRMTWADGWDVPCCWLPDSSGVVLRSYRRDYGADLWVAKLDGTQPYAITDAGFRESETHAAISPDGKTIAYVRRGSSSSYRRRAYTGSANNDIWVCGFDGVTTKNHRKISESLAHDTWPYFKENGSISWVSFSNGKEGSRLVPRIATRSLNGGAITFDDSFPDPRWPTFAAGKTVCASGNYGGWGIYLSDGTGKAKRLKIDVASDVRTAKQKIINDSTADEFAVSSDGKLLAFIASGDVFVMPTEDGGVPFQITDTVCREKDLVFSSDDTKLAYATRRTDGYDVAMYDLIERKESVLVDKDVDCAHPQFTPDNKRLIYCEADARLRDVDLEGKQGELDIEGTFWGSNRWGGNLFDISSDGRWILFERTNENFDDEIWLAETETGKARRLTRMFQNTAHGRFSSDGKWVVFVCSQEGSYDVYGVRLTRKSDEFAEDKLGNAIPKPKDKEDESDESKDGSDEEKAKDAKETNAVEVDFNGIDERIERFSSMSDNEFSPVCFSDGETILFTAENGGTRNIWKLTNSPTKGPKLKQLTQSRGAKSGIDLSKDNKYVWYTDGGKIQRLSVNGGSAKTYSFRVSLRRDRNELRREAFDEAVWVMDRYFYDPSFHGRDLKGLSKRYRKALNGVSTGNEWGSLMNDLWGELNSSHQGFSAKDGRTDDGSDSCGWLGLRFDQSELAKGRWKISEVVKNGPCDKPDVEIRAGDFLVGVGDDDLKQGDNLFRVMRDRIGKKTTLRIANSPDAETRTADVKPISRRVWFQLLYDRWVEKNRQMVHKLSDGRLGYVHVRGMDDPSLRHFKHQLGDENIGTDAMVIDVRYNGGGYTAVHLLEILVKRPWLRRTSRGLAFDVSENIYRSVALEKPSCLLCNQDSFSNAEIMTEGFNRLKIGPTIGMPTAGGVIGTSSYDLIDGSRTRLPVSGAYTVDGENLENIGRVPQFVVDNDPDDLNAGRDLQIEKAVKELLAKLPKKEEDK